MTTQFTVPKRKPKRRRPAQIKKRSGVAAVPSGSTGTGGIGGARESIYAAAQIFCDKAKANAAKFSVRIPLATWVTGTGEQSAMVETDGAIAPNAAPFEFGLRHPLFGRAPWYKQPTRAYMSNAATNKGTIEAALNEYGDIEAQLLEEEFGFTE